MATDGRSKPDRALRSWLAELGLEQYAESFEQNDIDLEALPDLDDLLEQLASGHRRAIRR